MRTYAIVTGAFLLLSQNASAAQIEILDCVGTEKAAYSVESQQTGTVNISVETLNGAGEGPAQLIADSGEVLVSEMRLGTAIFSDVGEGSWRFCPERKESVLKNVSLAKNEVIAAESTTTLGVVGVGIAGVGSVVAMNAGGSGSRSESAAVVPVGTNVNAATRAPATTAPLNTGVGGKAGVNINAQSSVPCFIGDEVVAMSPFS